MFLILTATDDTYITNKIIDNTFRAKGANVGRASTLDLFKLYDESTFIENGQAVTSSVRETSRALLKFDLGPLRNLTGSICNVNDPSFRVDLQLFDVASGLPVPNNFRLLISPLSRSFSEGRGRNIDRFSDLDAANYVTASYTNGSNILWNTEGCNKSGGLSYVAATASITIDDFTINGTIIISDGTKTVTFTSNAGSTAAAKTDDTNYTYGIQGLADVNTAASRLYAAIALAKTNTDLSITSVDPGGASAIITLTQDVSGLSGNTTITGTATAACTIVGFKDGYDPSGLDYFTSGTYGGGVYDFGSHQLFEQGNEDLNVNITTYVSATLANHLPDAGVRIAFSGTDDSDQKSRFAKRFASRHTKNQLLIPRLLVSFDSHIDDYHAKMRFNKNVNLFLSNKVSGKLQNLLSASADPGGAIVEVTGENCLKVTLTSGSVVKSFDASQYVTGTDLAGRPGIYKTTFLLSRFDSDFFTKSNSASSIEMSEVWSSADLHVPYYSGTLEIKTTHASANPPYPPDLLINPLGHKEEYHNNENITVRFLLKTLTRIELKNLTEFQGLASQSY